MTNQKIRDYASKKRVFLWQIAMKLNINDGNFSRRLRREFSKEESEKIIGFIDEIASENTCTGKTS